jgi:hypothetical protein
MGMVGMVKRPGGGVDAGAAGSAGSMSVAMWWLMHRRLCACCVAVEVRRVVV